MNHKVVIVGGGTAGWSAAAILSAMSGLDITVVDPSTIPTIGVGESTLPHINKAHRATALPGLKDESWVDKVDGTIKVTIEFGNFNELGGRWSHPFLAPGPHEKSVLRDKFNKADDELYTSSQPDFAANNTTAGRLLKSGYIEPSRFKPLTNFSGGAYHLNAALYANLLRTESCTRGNVRRIDDEVADVALTENGFIDHLKMKGGAELRADLFIDCTGFSAVLANAVDSKWTSVSDRLFVDGVWLLQLPYADRKKQLINTTYCHALGNGWVFHIPLQSRVGTGYIFSSRHTTKEAALKEYQTHLKQSFGYRDEDVQNARLLRFNTGYRRDLWKKNVVSIGLGGFFCEPIESTAIAISQFSVMELRNYLMMPKLLHETFANRFNDLMIDQHRAVIEFVELHYSLSSRNDTAFWRDYASKEKSDLARKVIELYRQCASGGPPLSEENFALAMGGMSGMFHELSYSMMFYGYGIRPNRVVW